MWYVVKSLKKTTLNRIICSEDCQTENAKRYRDKIKIETEFKIFERDGFKCVYCGKSSIENGVKLHVDHIFPKIKGGDNNPINLTTACQDCNISKNAEIMSIDIINRLWKRNLQLQIKFNYNYSELQREFNKKWNIKPINQDDEK